MNLSESSLFGFRFHFSWFHLVRGKIYLAKDVANHLLSDFGFFVFLTYGYIIYQTNKVNVIQNKKYIPYSGIKSTITCKWVMCLITCMKHVRTATYSLFLQAVKYSSFLCNEQPKISIHTSTKLINQNGEEQPGQYFMVNNF